MIIPTNGARKMKATVLRTIAELMTLNVPAFAMAAPANPPISVCDEEEGMPDHQVKRFQVIAAISPDKMTYIISAFWMPSAFTVLATVSATP